MDCIAISSVYRLYWKHLLAWKSHRWTHEPTDFCYNTWKSWSILSSILKNAIDDIFSPCANLCVYPCGQILAPAFLARDDKTTSKIDSGLENNVWNHYNSLGFLHKFNIHRLSSICPICSSVINDSSKKVQPLIEYSNSPRAGMHSRARGYTGGIATIIISVLLNIASDVLRKPAR